MRSQERPEPEREQGQHAPAGACWLAEAFAAASGWAWSWDASTGRVRPFVGAPAPFDPAPSTLEELDQLVHEEDRAARRSILARALERGEPWVCTFRLARSAEARWVEERGRAWLGAEGKAARAVALALDVTAQTLAEQALESVSRSEAFLESILASMEDGLVLYDPAGRITRMNRRARELLGYGDAEQAEPIHARLARLRILDVHGKPVPDERLPMIAALRGESSHGVPLTLHLTGDRAVWITAGAAPIRGPDGAIVGAVLTLSDVTRLRELQEHREDLARMISHDLRTPLGVILGQAKLLGRRHEGPSGVRSRSEAILASAQRMSAMLNDLVESALLEAGKLRLELSPCDLVRMVRELRSRLAAPFEGERIRLETRGKVPPTLADPNRFERVLVNLLTNALKYSAPASEVVVRVGVDAGHVVLEVEDSGPGIAPEDLPHLFERFFRAFPSSRFEGMGLGLYTARMLVEAHGGTIGVRSVLGQGSVFCVRVPLRDLGQEPRDPA